VLHYGLVEFRSFWTTYFTKTV